MNSVLAIFRLDLFAMSQRFNLQDPRKSCRILYRISTRDLRFEVLQVLLIFIDTFEMISGLK